MGDPERAEEMEDIIARYGEVQARSRNWTVTRWRAGARSPGRLSFSQEMMDGDVGALSGGWKMRVALGASS